MAKYIPQKHSVIPAGSMPCEYPNCLNHATFYEHPIEGNDEFYYAACDRHWKEMDEQVSK